MFHDIDSATPATTPPPPVTTPPPPATTTGNNAKIIFALLWPLIEFQIRRKSCYRSVLAIVFTFQLARVKLTSAI